MAVHRLHARRELRIKSPGEGHHVVAGVEEAVGDRSSHEPSSARDRDPHDPILALNTRPHVACVLAGDGRAPVVVELGL